MMKKIFTLIAVAVMAFAAQANILTVCNGSATSGEVPIDGYNYDLNETTSQMIYPANMLTDMVGATITQVKFYSPSVNFMGGELWLMMSNTSQTAFVDGEPANGTVFCGSVTPVLGSSELTFVFDTPFVYEGGNLLIDVFVYTPGVGGSTSFYGVNMDYNASINSYPNSDIGFIEYTANHFLPKVTFTYETPVVPTEKTGAPTFHGYTEDGIHGYFVEIIPTEESVIYYRVIYPDGTETEWAEYEKILEFEGDGKHRVEAYAVASGKLPSEEIAYEFVVSPITGIDEMVSGRTVAGVRYFNMAGQEMSEANGLTIVVTTYTDGTTSAVKVMK